MDFKNLDKHWWNELAIAIIATTVSIILTFGTASLFDRREQKKERKLTALMSMVLAIRGVFYPKIFFARALTASTLIGSRTISSGSRSRRNCM